MTSLRPLELPNSAMPARKSAKGDSTEDAHLERRDGAYDDRPCEPEPRDLSIPAVKRSNVPHVDVPLAGAPGQQTPVTNDAKKPATTMTPAARNQRAGRRAKLILLMARSDRWPLRRERGDIAPGPNRRTLTSPHRAVPARGW